MNKLVPTTPLRPGIRGVSAAIAERNAWAAEHGLQQYPDTPRTRTIINNCIDNLDYTVTRNYSCGGPSRCSTYSLRYCLPPILFDTLPENATATDGEIRVPLSRKKLRKVAGLRGCTHRVLHFVDGAWRTVALTHKAVSPNVLKPHHIMHLLSKFIHAPLVLRWDMKHNLPVVCDGAELYHVDLSKFAYNAAGLRGAVQCAISALRKRRDEKERTAKSEKVTAFLAAHLDRVFVDLEDSYRSGNCVPMSDRFAKEIWDRLGAGPCAVRADVVLAMRNDSYTQRAVRQAALRYV